MITGFFIYLLGSVLSGILSLLPQASLLPTGMTDAFTTFVSAINTMNFIFPMTQLMNALTFTVGIQMGIWGIEFYQWVYKRIRG